MIETTSLFNEDKEQETIIDIYLDLFLELNKDIMEKTASASYSLMEKSVIEGKDSVHRELYLKTICPILKSYAEYNEDLGIAKTYKLCTKETDGSDCLKMLDANDECVYCIEISFDKEHWIGSVTFKLSGKYTKFSTVTEIFCSKLITYLTATGTEKLRAMYHASRMASIHLCDYSREVKAMMIAQLGEDEFRKLRDSRSFLEADILTLKASWDNFDLRDKLGVCLNKPPFSEVYNAVNGEFLNPKDSRLSDCYFIGEMLSRLDKKDYVMTGTAAICYNGMAPYDYFIPELLTACKELDNIVIGGVASFHYSHNLDYDRYAMPVKGFEHIRIPNISRSIVENIKYHLDYVELGSFLEYLDRYAGWGNYDREQLVEVANYFGVSMKIVDFWILDCSDYNSNGLFRRRG